MTPAIQRKAAGAGNLARMTGIGSIGPLAEKFPAFAAALKPEEQARLALLIAVASAWTAAIRIEADVPGEDRTDARRSVLDQIAALHPQGLQLADDLGRFVADRLGKPEGEQARDAAHRTLVGMWVLWNARQRPPADDELEVTGAVGTLCWDVFKSYWTVPDPAEGQA